MAQTTAFGFFSYARFDDRHERGRLSLLRERLSGEVQIQTGQPFPIFQDQADLLWGDPWQSRLQQAIDGTSFLIPILTPSFFRSTACRREVGRFLHRERRAPPFGEKGGADRILPIYWVDAFALSHPAGLAGDPIARALAGRQWADWRSLRLEPPDSLAWDRAIIGLAQALRERLHR
ncbi:MAG TPA: toll/interleukin-1 receptor domain-containing protein [Symbiobacteriaceae bacterium]|nr:toll/interleukin-1 receptor domain-containing protein [Symbiobacteriaceae bacterium]